MCLLNSSLAVLRAEGNILGCTRGWLCNFNGWSYGTELFFFFKAVCFLISNPIYYFQTHTENHEYVQSEAIQSALAVVAQRELTGTSSALRECWAGWRPL